MTYADTYYPNNAENKAALQAPGSNLYLLPGKRLTYAPLWSAVVGADFEHELFDKLVGTASVDMKYSSSYNVGSDEDPIKNQPGFFLVGASVGIATADKRIALADLEHQHLQPVLQADRVRRRDPDQLQPAGGQSGPEQLLLLPGPATLLRRDDPVQILD